MMNNLRSEGILKSIEDSISRCDELSEEIRDNIKSTKKEIEEREMKKKIKKMQHK